MLYECCVSFGWCWWVLVGVGGCWWVLVGVCGCCWALACVGVGGFWLPKIKKREVKNADAMGDGMA